MGQHGHQKHSPTMSSTAFKKRAKFEGTSAEQLARDALTYSIQTQRAKNSFASMDAIRARIQADIGTADHRRAIGRSQITTSVDRCPAWMMMADTSMVDSLAHRSSCNMTGQRMSPLRRYASFYIAVLAGWPAGACAVAVAVSRRPDRPPTPSSSVYLSSSELLKFPGLTPQFLKKHAASTDEPAWIIVHRHASAPSWFAVGSLFVLVNKGGRPDALELRLSLTAVALGWFTIHTMTALHYAHLYWRPEDLRRQAFAGQRGTWRARLSGRRRAGRLRLPLLFAGDRHDGADVRRERHQDRACASSPCFTPWSRSSSTRCSSLPRSMSPSRSLPTETVSTSRVRPVVRVIDIGQAETRMHGKRIGRRSAWLCRDSCAPPRR